MAKKGSVLNRQYIEEFKYEAMRLIESIGGNQAAKRPGIPDSSLWSWIRLSFSGKLKAGELPGRSVKRSATELEAEYSRLRRELASAKQDLEIAKKAVAYFAKESR